jgi:hypothetical protein
VLSQVTIPRGPPRDENALAMGPADQVALHEMYVSWWRGNTDFEPDNVQRAFSRQWDSYAAANPDSFINVRRRSAAINLAITSAGGDATLWSFMSTPIASGVDINGVRFQAGSWFLSRPSFIAGTERTRLWFGRVVSVHYHRAPDQKRRVVFKVGGE